MSDRAKEAGETGVRVLGSGRYLTLLDDHGWEYVTRPTVTGIVVIVAITDEEKLLLVEQYRPAVQRRVVELPAGLVGDVDAAREPGSSPRRRELGEETGFAARRDGAAGRGAGRGRCQRRDGLVLSCARPHPGRPGRRRRQREHHHPRGAAVAAARVPGRPAADGLAIDPKIYAGLYLVGAAVRRDVDRRWRDAAGAARLSATAVGARHRDLGVRRQARALQPATASCTAAWSWRCSTRPWDTRSPSLVAPEDGAFNASAR